MNPTKIEVNEFTDLASQIESIICSYIALNLPPEQLYKILRQLLIKLQQYKSENDSLKAQIRKLQEKLDSSNQNYKKMKEQYEKLEKLQEKINEEVQKNQRQYDKLLAAQKEENIKLDKRLNKLLKDKVKEKQTFENLAKVEEVRKTELIEQLKQKWTDIHQANENIRKRLDDILNQPDGNIISLEKEQKSLNELQLSFKEYENVFKRVEEYEQLLRKKSTAVPQDSKSIIEQMLKLLQYNKNIMQNFFQFIKEIIEEKQDLIAQNKRLFDENQELRNHSKIVNGLFQNQQVGLNEAKDRIEQYLSNNENQFRGGNQNISHLSIIRSNNPAQIQELTDRLKKLNSDLKEMKKEWIQFKQAIAYPIKLLNIIKNGAG